MSVKVKTSKSGIDAAVAAMVAAGAAASVGEAAEAAPVGEVAEVAAVEVAVKPKRVRKAAAAAKEKSVSKKVVAKKVAKKAGSKSGKVVVKGFENYREKGMLSFGRWFALLGAVAAKNEKKMIGSEAAMKNYKAGKSPREVLGLA
jgi:hypothetical protein